MKYSSRFFLYAPVTLFLVLAVLVALHWQRTASAFEARLAALKGHEAIPGVTLDWSKAAVSGFPFRLDATFDGFSARGQGVHGPFGWTSEHFAMHALTYGAQKDVFEAAGSQHLSWTGADGRPHAFTFLPGSLRASTVRDAAGLSRFDVDIVGLDGQGPDKGIDIGRAQFHMRQGGDGKAIELMAEGEAVKGPGPLGGVRSLRTYQTLSQAAAFAGLLRGEQSAAAAHAAWDRAGGRMTPTRTEINGATTQLQLDQLIASGQLLAPLY
jgi:hypothetical protein